nr:hypothetical protein [uncultured Steroidobacter sp.]
MTSSAHEMAVAMLSIQDVFLVEARHTVVRDHNPQETLESVSFQLRHHIDPEVMLQRRGDGHGNETQVLRCFVNTGFRALRADASEKNIAEHMLAEIECVFAADYLVKSEEAPSSEIVSAFGENIVFHVWPYWREYVQSTLARSRLPSIALPMFRVRQKPASSESKSPMSPMSLEAPQAQRT